jgi:hypothetical protein
MIASGISWNSYLRLAAHYYGVTRGMVTDGFKLQVVDYKSLNKEPLCWSEFDTIICEQNVASFVAIYNALSASNHHNKNLQESASTKHDLRVDFWRGLVDQTKIVLPRFYKIKPSPEQWISAGAGKSGFCYSFVIRKNDAQIELQIAQEDAKKNKQFFDLLYARRELIEKVFGNVLHWERLDDKKACRISYSIHDSGLATRESWLKLQKRMIDEMVQLEKAFDPEIRGLK